nr:type II and III secretion system protein [Gloeobacter morelensis]
MSEGKGRLLTDTKLSTVSGQKAALDVQTDINLTLTTQSTVNSATTNTTTINTLRAGTVVELEPTVQADSNVLAVLNLESSVAGARANTNTAPDISRRKVRNTLLLKNNQTIEIGGLIQSNNTENVTRIPIVGYLPLIGQLFSNTSVSVDQRELLVFITPRIRDVQPLPDTQLPLGPAR